MQQVSSSFPESQLGLSEEAHTLTFVWDASKLPHRLIKGAKEMKESIKVTLFPQPAHTHTHWFHYMNDSFVIGAFKMKCFCCILSVPPVSLKAHVCCWNNTLSHVRIQDFTLYIRSYSSLPAWQEARWPLTGYARIWATVLWNAVDVRGNIMSEESLCPHKKVCLPVSGSTSKHFAQSNQTAAMASRNISTNSTIQERAQAY